MNTFLLVLFGVLLAWVIALQLQVHALKKDAAAERQRIEKHVNAQLNMWRTFISDNHKRYVMLRGQCAALAALLLEYDLSDAQQTRAKSRARELATLASIDKASLDKDLTDVFVEISNNSVSDE